MKLIALSGLPCLSCLPVGTLSEFSEEIVNSVDLSLTIGDSIGSFFSLPFGAVLALAEVDLGPHLDFMIG